MLGLERVMDLIVTGTHIWYYCICRRQVWLISHQITPDQENENIVLGRYFDQESFQREKKSLEVESNRIDIFHSDNGKLVVGEVKKSSRFVESARMQLAYYLLKLKQNGVDAEGVLRFPKEKTSQEVKLDAVLERNLLEAVEEIRLIMAREMPPPPVLIGFCKNCAYAEFCWS